jgi:ribosomal protein S18 acetylase RimI-like enzyme
VGGTVARVWEDGAVDDATLAARRAASMRALYGALASSSPGARLLEVDGVRATLVPTSPDRSIFNGVVYDDPDGLAAALPELAAAYEEIGVRAWTVWVSADDDRTRKVLADAGHRLDGEPVAMGAELTEVDSEAGDDVEIDAQAGWDVVARLNGAAYDMGESFVAPLSGIDTGYLYVARLDGRPAACVTSRDHDGDCGIYFVATVPEARGRGLCTQLMRRALHEARERGCETTTLEGSVAGRHIYARLGYRTLGGLELWERRAATAS